MDDLRLPRDRVPIELWLSGGGREDTSVFLHPDEGRPLADRIERLLLEPEPFFAVGGEGEIRLVARAAVVAAWIAREAPGGAAPLRSPVSVRLADGTIVAGEVCYWMPPERARLTDFLNQSSPFLTVDDGRRVALLRKDRVVEIVLPR